MKGRGLRIMDGSRRRVNLEDREQTAFFRWAMTCHTPFGQLSGIAFAIPNGAWLHGDEGQRARQMHRMKQCGLTPGVADIFVPIPNRQWHGLFIEMKRPRRDPWTGELLSSKISAEQKGFGEGVLERGYLWIVCFGADEAIQTVREYLDSSDPIIEPAYIPAGGKR